MILKYLNYTITYQNGESVINNQVISANTSQRLLVKVEYRKDLIASDLPSTTQTLNLSFVVSYVQSDGSGISVPGNGKDLISFSIGGTSYQAEKGMTWEEWADSEYDTNDNFMVIDTGLSGSKRIRAYNLPGYSSATLVRFVGSNDIIESQMAYELSDPNA